MKLKLRELIFGFTSILIVLGMFIWGMYKLILWLANIGWGPFPCLMVLLIVMGALIGTLAYFLQK